MTRIKMRHMKISKIKFKTPLVNESGDGGKLYYLLSGAFCRCETILNSFFL